MHRRVQSGHFYSIPERAPNQPRLVVVVNHEVRVNGIPVVTLLTRSYDTTLVIPNREAQRRLTQQADSRTVLTEGRTTISHPPTSVPLDYIRSPHMVSESRHRITCPLRHHRHHGLRQYRPCLTVLGGHLLDAHPRAEQVVSTVLIRHHRVVRHWRLRLESRTCVMRLRI